MKQILLLFLISFTCCQLVQSKGKSELDGILCLIEKALPLYEEVLDLIDALEQGDQLGIIMMTAILIEEGKEAYISCFEDDIKEVLQVDENKNWRKFCNCLYDKTEYHVPENLKPLTNACSTGDYNKVFSRVYGYLGQGYDYVDQCFREA